MRKRWHVEQVLFTVCMAKSIVAGYVCTPKLGVWWDKIKKGRSHHCSDSGPGRPRNHNYMPRLIGAYLQLPVPLKNCQILNRVGKLKYPISLTWLTQGRLQMYMFQINLRRRTIQHGKPI
jgi:hypothetical protein